LLSSAEEGSRYGKKLWDFYSWRRERKFIGDADQKEQASVLPRGTRAAVTEACTDEMRGRILKNERKFPFRINYIDYGAG
jgi:hypothetical protein